MKNNNFAIFPAIAMVVLFSGCGTMYSGFGTYDQERQERQYQRDQTRLREQMAQRQLQQNADSALSAARDAESRIRYLEQRMERLEATSLNVTSYASLADIDALRRENESLRAQLAETRASQESMRAEIISNVQSLLKEQQNRAATAPKAVAQSLSGYEHKVESGQTLSAIAKAYGVSVKKIKDANNLTSDAIRVGQVLFIPD